MTKYQQKCLELRRMKYEIEARRAKRAQSTAEWMKVIAAIAASILMVGATFAIIHAHNRRVLREVDVETLKQDVYTMTIEAADAVRENPNNGLAKFALLFGIALYCADVRDAEG